MYIYNDVRQIKFNLPTKISIDQPRFWQHVWMYNSKIKECDAHKTSSIQSLAQRERESCERILNEGRWGRREMTVSTRRSVHVQVFLQGCHHCFTSTVAVCSRRVGRPTPVLRPRGREYWGAMPAEGGWRVATIKGVQEPWRREEG